METKPLVPRLRFPEFRDAPEWKERMLCEILHEHGLRSDGQSEVHSVSVHKGIINQVEHLGRSFAASDTAQYNLVKPHDVVYTKSPTGDFPYGIVKQSKLVHPGIVSPLYGVFTPESEHMGYILDAHFESPTRTNNYLAPITQKGAKNTIQISNATFLSRGLLLPSDPAEQRKIAECLMSLDQLIAAAGRELDALRAHKKGMMRNLLPREGETTPRLRFSEFHSAGEWPTRPLSEIAEVKLGKMLDARKHTSGQLLPYVNNIAVRWGEVDTTNLPQMYFNANELERYGLRDGDVLVCEGGEPGRSAVWDGRLPELKFQKAVHRVRFRIPYKPPLLVLYLEALSGTIAFERLFTGGGIRHLTGETFARLAVPVPPIQEQSRIASCLGALDALITAQVDKLNSLKFHNRGLMQALFPSPEENHE